MNLLNKLSNSIFLVVVLVAISIPGYSQWTLNNSGTVQDLDGVYVLSPTKAFITGNNGTMLVTNDAAASFSPVAVPTAQDINGIHFVNDFVGYAGVDNGGVLKTIDGGAAWSFQSVGTGSNMKDVFFVDANTGYVVGEDGSIFKTINGGTSWSMQTSGTTERLESVFFTSATVGYTVGRSGVYLSTTNGGSIWTSSAIAAGADLKDVFFVDANNGFISRQNNFIQKTTNAGATWQTISMNAVGNGFDAMHFTDLNNGWGVNNNGFLAHSTNSGLTWAVQASGTVQDLNNIHCFDGGNCMIVGNAGTVLSMFAPQGCVTPVGLLTNNLTGTSATLNWTSVDAANSYEIRGNVVGSANIVSIIVPGGTTNSFNVANLAKGTMYEWQIRSLCGAGQMSDFSSLVNFTTRNCLSPSPVSTSNITSTSATLNWTPTIEAQGYRIIGRVQGSSNIVQITVAGGASNTFVASGLAPNTTFEWTAISNCNIPGALFSNLANVETFTTLAAASSKTAEQFPAQLILFPNPANGIVHIRLQGTGMDNVTQVSIMDISGKIVRQTNSNENSIQMDIKDLAAGIYQVVIENDILVKTEKLIVRN